MALGGSMALAHHLGLDLRAPIDGADGAGRFVEEP
jgi:hypothetical protein